MLNRENLGNVEKKRIKITPWDMEGKAEAGEKRLKRIFSYRDTSVSFLVSLWVLILQGAGGTHFGCVQPFAYISASAWNGSSYVPPSFLLPYVFLQAKNVVIISILIL